MVILGYWSGSNEQLPTFLVSRHGKLRLVGALCGANDGASESAVPTNDPPSDINTNLVSMPYTEGILTLLSEHLSVEVAPRGYQEDEQLIPRLQTAQFNQCLPAVAESGSAFHHEAPCLTEEASCLSGKAKEAVEPQCPTSTQAQYPSATETIAGAGCLRLSKPGQIEQRKQFLVDKNSSDDIRIDLRHFLKQLNHGNRCLESAIMLHSNFVVRGTSSRRRSPSGNLTDHRPLPWAVMLLYNRMATCLALHSFGGKM